MTKMTHSEFEARRHAYHVRFAYPGCNYVPDLPGFDDLSAAREACIDLQQTGRYSAVAVHNREGRLILAPGGIGACPEFAGPRRLEAAGYGI